MDAEAMQGERVRQLEREQDSLRAYLEEKEQAVVKAAELGKALLRENERLEEQLGEANRESTQKIEELEQVRFSLQQKLECQKAAILAVQYDMESVKTELRKEHEMREEHLKQAHSKKVHEVELLCSDLRAETERLEAQGKAYKERIAGLEDRLREATERAENATSSSYLQPELRDLEQQCAQERCEKEELQAQLCDAQEECGLLGMEVGELRSKVETLTDECQERSDQANEWYRSLQASKEHVMELNAQLEALKIEMGNNHRNSGNSLFGEVDDRRLQVERKYVSLEVKHDSLDRRHTSMALQYKRLKADMSSLLCQFGVVGADAAHIRRLEVALRQAQTEKESILTKLHKLEKQQASIVTSQERLQYVAAFGDKKEYIALIELQLNRARKEIATLTKDLEVKGLQLVWETQKLRETEDRLHRREQEMARGQKEVSIFKLKLQEMLEKLEQADSRCKQQEAQVNLLEKELQAQRHRGPQSKTGQQSSRRESSSSAINNSLTTQHQTTASGKPATEKHADSLEDELGGGPRGPAKTDKENERQLKSVPAVSKKEVKAVPFKQDVAPISFLEDMEREFEKQNTSMRGGGPGTKGTNLMRNLPKAAQKQSYTYAPPVCPVTTRTVALDSKVNQCPQQ